MNKELNRAELDSAWIKALVPTQEAPHEDAVPTQDVPHNEG